MATRRRPEKSGVAKAAEKLGGLIPGGGGQKPTRGAAGGRSKRGTAGRLALLAGAAGLAVKNRDKLMSMIRGGDSSHEASHPVEPQPLPSTPAAPETNTAGTPLSSTDHPPA